MQVEKSGGFEGRVEDKKEIEGSSSVHEKQLKVNERHAQTKRCCYKIETNIEIYNTPTCGEGFWLCWAAIFSIFGVR